MRIALINSGIGLLAPAAALHRLRPDADLVLASDPDGMPWGPRTPAEIVERSLLCARAAAACEPDVIVMACNTGTVHALDALRAEFEPDIPVIGTVPAIKPAAAAHRVVAIWATVATTNSAYQRRLIAEFGGSAEVTPVACPGLADAIDAGNEEAAAAAIATAAAHTPPGCQAVILGCTEYELAAAQIAAAVPGAVTLGSAGAVAAQALRRAGGIAVGLAPATAVDAESATVLDAESATVLDAESATALDAESATALGAPPQQPGAYQCGTVYVLLSGRPSRLPDAAFGYQEGRLLAPLVVDPAREPAPFPARPARPVAAG
jgi:glutamate racemase